MNPEPMGWMPRTNMRKLVVGTFLTLDGVMQAPGGPDEDRDGGFQHGGWLVPYFDEKFLEIMTEWTKGAGAFLFGRKTYEIFANSWPRSTDPVDEIATVLNARPKFVASRTLHEVTWNNAHLLKGDVAEEVAKLKSEDGARFKFTAAAICSKPCSSAISLIRFASGSFLWS